MPGARQTAAIIGNNSNMPLTIPIAHDYNCGWCWIGFSQVKKLQREFGANFEWISHELVPGDLEWPEPILAKPEPPNKPKTPSRFQLALAAEGLDPLIGRRPHNMRTHNALEATEYAKTEGNIDAFVERLYVGHWICGLDINDLHVLKQLSLGLIKDVEAMMKAIEDRLFDDKIVKFDDNSYAVGVYNLPTFWINGQRYAEQPYSVVRKAVLEVL